MGFFDKLFGTSKEEVGVVDENKYIRLLKVTKVGLAFLSGSDSGAISLFNRGGSIEFFLSCRTTFFRYNRELGIGIDSLVKGINCPGQEWNDFVEMTEMQIMPKGIVGDDVIIKSKVQIRSNSYSMYLDKLCRDLRILYPGIQIDLNNREASILVSGSQKDNFKYR